MKNITFTQAFAATVLGLAGFAAQAAQPVVTDANYPGPTSLQSNKTRAEVSAELAQAKAAGQVFDAEQAPFQDSLASNVSRAQVEAELAQYKAQGLGFNNATYPVPSHNLPSKQAQQRLANLTSNGQTTLVR